MCPRARSIFIETTVQAVVFSVYGLKNPPFVFQDIVFYLLSTPRYNRASLTNHDRWVFNERIQSCIIIVMKGGLVMKQPAH